MYLSHFLVETQAYESATLVEPRETIERALELAAGYLRLGIPVSIREARNYGHIKWTAPKGV